MSQYLIPYGNVLLKGALKKMQKNWECLLYGIRETAFKDLTEKVYFQVPDTGTRVLDNTTRPFLRSSIVSFWITPARSKEH